jgi:cytochrome c oxidase assembly factor CtaG
MKKIIEAVKGLRPNRVAVYMTSAAGLLTAAAPIVADLDTSDVVGMASGLAAIVAVVDRFLRGWQRHEDREAGVV